MRSACLYDMMTLIAPHIHICTLYLFAEQLLFNESSRILSTHLGLRIMLADTAFTMTTSFLLIHVSKPKVEVAYASHYHLLCHAMCDFVMSF